METNHTPGPWEIEEGEGTHWIRAEAGNGTGWVGERYMAVSGCIDIHDARLIAAAPDLLEALEACYAALHPNSAEGQAARAAIAKATGSAA